jgi:S1-C subfamily serine protease
MKKLCLALVAALALLVPVTGFTDLVTSAVRVSVRKLDNAVGFGSGVVLAPGIVLTAQHVTFGGKLRIDDGKALSETIADAGGTRDIAILRFPKAEAACPCAYIADYPAMLDEPVWVVGYPAGIGQVVTIGTSQGTMDVTLYTAYGPERFGERLVLTARVIGGNSGGGVFVLRGGMFQLVGIIVEGDNFFALAIPLQDIKAFIAKHQSKF